MPRVVGVDIPGDKKVPFALQYIYGIGTTLSKRIVADLKLNPAAAAKELTEDDLSRLSSYIEKNFVVEGSLRRQVSQAIARLKDINCYRGIRHRRGLPVRGQRTRCNARTRKGPRKTVAGKKSPKEVK
jgi:small subunit ribosomal protein S13